MKNEKCSDAVTPQKIILCGTNAMRKTADDEFPVGDNTTAAVFMYSNINYNYSYRDKEKEGTSFGALSYIYIQTYIPTYTYIHTYIYISYIAYI
jgi:hypothetical protein